MAREVAEDFEQLVRFVREYRLPDPAATPQFRTLLSRQHKLYHAVLTLLAELEHQAWSPLDLRDARAAVVNQVFRERWLECASDLGSALFSWLHGAYKGARLLLRSAIENAIKAFGIIDDDRAVTLKNTYEVFDVAQSSAFFADAFHATRFSSLHQAYSLLSRDVHTATRNEMQHVDALDFFPQFAPDDAQRFATMFCTVAGACLEALVLLAQAGYHAMHYRNRDIVNLSLSGEVLERLNRVERA